MKRLARTSGVLICPFILTFGIVGCATRGFVRQEFTRLESRVQSNRAEIEEIDQVNAQQREQLAELSGTVQEALTRARESAKLAKGEFLYEVIFTEDVARFSFGSAELSGEAKGALDALAERLKSENKSVYIEIQGHTDSVGSEAYNLRLGMARAEAVRKYLYTAAGIPLHRMSTFSYGEAKPLAKNKTPENRLKNRRATLVIME